MKANSLLFNAGMCGAAQGFGKVVRFAITSAALLRFGTASWGEVAFALTVITYLNFVLDFGISSLALIEHPDDETLDRKLFVTLGYSRGIVLAVLALIGVVAFVASGVSGNFILKVYLLQAFLRPFNLDWWLSRKGFVGINPLVQCFRQVLVLALLFLLDVKSIEHFVILDVGSEILATAVLWLCGPKKRFSVGIPSLAELKDSFGCYKLSFVLFISSSLLLLHQNFDILFLHFAKGDEAVGVYDYCYRYVLFAFMIGGSLSVPLRRQLARLKDLNEGDRCMALVFSSHKILGIFSGAFLFFCLAFSDLLFSLFVPLNGSFPASRTLIVLACWLIVSFYSIPWSEWLISESKKKYLQLAIVAGVVNVFTNFLLVPSFGIVGAALAKVLSESGIFLFLFFQVSSKMRMNFLKVLVAHVPLYPLLAFYFVQGYLPYWLLGIVFAMELVLLFATRYFTKADLKLLAKGD